ncbi:hypothetical protein FHS61_001603 [Altererythrobacter atlanticus]|uniref:Inner membrane protein YbaN n=1 Tax=Croceibacterium atlanticum TaxID=1267766 RepID=A0A0F7KND9_9SPHN|nr:YbaN family protein [Croceibacterium atlanticum]AKH41079.1 Inner membrane protein YbaN [Croceibacterium atlanticum]MBB5732594.1 hypothetical protein [Croceibacterium atlanticum]
MPRPFWFAAGLFFLTLGWIGVILPMMPGFVFFLVAAFCFARGNPAWERKMLEHPRYGKALRDWREKRAISRKAKISAITAMALAGSLTWYLVGYPWALLSVGMLVAVAVWIWTRNE